MTAYIVILATGIAFGYLIGSIGLRQQRNDDIQLLIDLEAAKRKEDGLYRSGDALTETNPAECGVFRTREIKR